jgi:hypothetical protein
VRSATRPKIFLSDSKGIACRSKKLTVESPSSIVGVLHGSITGNNLSLLFGLSYALCSIIWF